MEGLQENEVEIISENDLDNVGLNDIDGKFFNGLKMIKKSDVKSFVNLVNNVNIWFVRKIGIFFYYLQENAYFMQCFIIIPVEIVVMGPLMFLLYVNDSR